MKIVCFPHFYYLSEVSRLVEMGQALRGLGQEVIFFSHGGAYEHVARQAGFEVVAVAPEMSPARAAEYMAFNRGEQGNPFRDSFFTDEELQAYVPSEADAFRQARADAVLIGWNLPSYLSAPLTGIPILVQQPGSFTAPFFDYKMGLFQPSLFGAARRLPLNWLVNWWLPRTKIWLAPFNRIAEALGLPQWKSTLDLLADIAVTHGGAGTVQTAIHSGTPQVGIPMHLEQTGNLSLVTRQGAGLMLSKWDLNKRSLGRALERLLADSSLREAMLHLKAVQDKVDGPANAAREIVNFLGATNSNMEAA